MLDKFEVPVDHKIDSLSRGKRSALGITLGLASRAPITMFDESYLGLDAPSRYMFYDELLADFMDWPRTIIISTHLIEEVSSIFEGVLIIDQGKLVLQDETGSILSRGVAITGLTRAVDSFTEGMRIIGTRALGPTTSAMVYGALDDTRR